MRSRPCIVPVLALLVLLAHGEQKASRVSVTVVDENGVAVVSARVTLQPPSPAQALRCETEISGRCELPYVPASLYQIHVEKEGYYTANSAVSSASWNGTGFSLGGISFPVTIPAGQSVPFTVTLAPQTTGPVNGTVSFLSNASNSPTNETLGGSGVQATPHSVGLSWNPDASTVQGYYVYRGAQTGGPYAKISTLQPGTSYLDASVLSGQTYYYVVTALGTNSQESTYSNEAVAVIP
jgi:hypothetical protein